VNTLNAPLFCELIIPLKFTLPKQVLGIHTSDHTEYSHNFEVNSYD